MKIRPLLAVLALVVGLASCSGGDLSTGPAAQVDGTYALRQFNGANVPATVFQNAEIRVEITSGALVLRQDRSYTETLQLRAFYTDGTTETDAAIENGTYAVSGSTVTFTVPPSTTEQGFSYSGQVEGRFLTYSGGDFSVRYERQ
ncbi:MAG TPA: hypothetical protein VHG51_15830 [Longimicrobiaceae bacterium]|nr:hypothetical protein [Longimicrobiaceae bacterium]